VGYRCHSITFDCLVDAAYKAVGSQVTNCSTHEEQHIAEARGVAKIETSLKEAMHVGLGEEEVHGIQEHVEGDRASREEGRPLPAVILCVE